MTLAQWLTAHVDGLTGIQEGTRKRYRGYIKADLADIGTLPLSAITETTIGRWVAGLESAKQSGKTIQDNYAFLSGSLKVAVRAGKLDRNPCEGRRLPRTERGAMVFISRVKFDGVRGDHTSTDGRTFRCSSFLPGCCSVRRPLCEPPTSTSTTRRAASPGRGSTGSRPRARPAEVAPIGPDHRPTTAGHRRHLATPR